MKICVNQKSLSFRSQIYVATQIIIYIYIYIYSTYIAFFIGLKSNAEIKSSSTLSLSKMMKTEMIFDVLSLSYL